MQCFAFHVTSLDLGLTKPSHAVVFTTGNTRRANMESLLIMTKSVKHKEAMLSWKEPRLNITQRTSIGAQLDREQRPLRIIVGTSNAC